MKLNSMLLAVALVLVSSCVSLQTPEGYAEMEYAGGHDYKAVSTDAAVVTVRVHRNQDKKQGTLDYWTEASRNQLTLSRGYTFKEEGQFVSTRGPGRWLLFEQRYKGTLYLYLLGLVVDGRKIFALEATGEKEIFQKDMPKLVKCFSSLR